MKKYKFFVNGEFIESTNQDYFDVINPATEEIIAKVPLCTEEDVIKAIDAAEIAFYEWSNKTVGERSTILLKVAEEVEKNIEQLALIESQNVGKPISLAREDVKTFVDNIRFYAGAARSMQGLSSGEYVENHSSIIRREPLGVIAAITPWNYPLYMTGTKIGPALVTGNTVVLKPSEFTPLSSLLLAELIKDVLPPGVLNVVTGYGETVGALLAENSKIKMVSLTGSVRAGKAVTEKSVDTLKRVHLELGGKAPVIVFDDANIKETVEGIRIGAFTNSGQDCTAATRIYVSNKIYDEFLKELINEVEKIKVGDPNDSDTEIGPLASKQHLERVAEFVERAKLNPDVKVLTGGKTLDRKGYYYQPTVIVGVKQNDEIVQEEVFGPVITVMPFSTDEEAYFLANDSKYALAASVWTTNVSRALVATKKIQAGTVWVNAHLLFSSEMPHGGSKLSGHGKEFSVYSLEEYTHIKHVMLKN